MTADSKDLMVRGSAMLPGLLVGEEADRLADGYAARATLDDYGRLSLPQLPSLADRHVLQKRVGDLEEVLSGIGPGTAKSPGAPGWRQARQALAALFSGYGSLQNANIAEKLDVYLAWLREFPAYAIVKACHDVGTTKARWVNPATGETEGPDPSFAPPTTVFHLLCSAIVKPRLDKLAQIEKVLRIKAVTAEEPTAEERERVKAAMMEFAASLRGRSGRSDVNERAAANERLEQAAAEVRAIKAARGRAAGVAKGD